jgi:hypothetical protein
LSRQKKTLATILINGYHIKKSVLRIAHTGIIRRMWSALGHFKLTDLRPLHLQDFYDSLLENTNLAPRSIHHIQRIVRNCLNMGVRLGEIKTNIASVVENVKVPKNEMHFWNTDEVMHLSTIQETTFIL